MKTSDKVREIEAALREAARPVANETEEVDPDSMVGQALAHKATWAEVAALEVASDRFATMVRKIAPHAIVAQMLVEFDQNGSQRFVFAVPNDGAMETRLGELIQKSYDMTFGEFTRQQVGIMKLMPLLMRASGERFLDAGRRLGDEHLKLLGAALSEGDIVRVMELMELTTGEG